MATASPVLTAVQSSIVLGKRKASQISSYVLHLASSPEPLAGPSDSEFEFLPEHSSSKSQLPAPVSNKPIIVNGKLVASDTKRRYKCTFDGCDKSYTKPSRLEEHERSHTGQRPFVCSTCNKSYLRETHLQAHARSHLPNSEKPLVCPQPDCAKRFWTNQHLRAHIDWHEGAKSFKCTEPNCNEAFAKHHQLRSHLCTAHAPPGTKPYQCSHEGCTKSFSTNQHLRTHMRVHNDKRYTCVQAACLPTLDRPAIFFPTWTALQHHIRTVHPPTCTHPSCNGKSFASQKGLRAHQKIHQQRDEEAQLDALRSDDDDQPPRKKRRGGEYGRDWKCEVASCGRDFKSSKALVIHNKVTHLGRRDFVCPHGDCGRAFGYKHLLQRHLAKLHQTSSGTGHSSSGNDGNGDDDDADSESSDSEQSVQKSKPSMVFSIDAITGTTYAARAKEQSKNGKALRCPYPLLAGIKTMSCSITSANFAGTAEAGPSSSNGASPNVSDCDYFFSRAYDLRRHLRAVHEVEADKESVDAWVAARKSKQA